MKVRGSDRNLVANEELKFPRSPKKLQVADSFSRCAPAFGLREGVDGLKKRRSVFLRMPRLPGKVKPSFLAGRSGIAQMASYEAERASRRSFCS